MGDTEAQMARLVALAAEVERLEQERATLFLRLHREAGVSLRALAEAAGVSHMTVRNIIGRVSSAS